MFNHGTRSIFAIGTIGSFKAVFADGGNAPAHSGVLQWLDRADIAGLNVPIPMALH